MTIDPSRRFDFKVVRAGILWFVTPQSDRAWSLCDRVPAWRWNGNSIVVRPDESADLVRRFVGRGYSVLTDD